MKPILIPGARVVVTGAGSGLGRALCQALAARGARLLAADIDLAGAEQTVRTLDGAADAVAVQCDVSRSEAVAALADEAEARWGGTDLLVNNAGVAVGGAVGKVSIDDWAWILGVNLWGVIHGCHHFVPRMRAAGAGAILNVSSAAGLLNPPEAGPYNVTKAGVVALSETMHAELTGSGVRVTVLCPTFFRTRINDSARGFTEGQTRLIGRLMNLASIQAEDVARAALDAVDSGDLYVLPHRDGRWLWRLKRALPQPFMAVLGVARRQRFYR